MIKQTLAEWRLWQESQGLSQRTIIERAATIRHLLAYTGAEPLTLTRRDIIRYTARQDISATSRATYHASIRAYCKWLAAEEYRDDDPSLRTPRPRRPKSRPRPVPAVHLEQLLGAANRRRTRMMLVLAMLAGLRVHEIAKFRGEDLDIDGARITVTGKGGKTATIPAHPQLIAEAATFPQHGYWFPAYTSQTTAAHVGAQAVSSAIANTMLRAGFHGRAHQLRHSFGTGLLREGVDLRVVQTLMRHESPATTAIYTQVDEDQQTAGIARLHLPGVSEWREAA